MLDKMYKSFLDNANCIKGWVNMSKTDLANGYCDADESGDTLLKEEYYSALMCKYWYMVPYLYQQSKSLKLEVEDFVFWLSESFDVAFKYRRWRDKSNPISKDKDAAEKIINRCIYSTRQRWYAYFNKDKRKVNFGTNYSIEENEEDFGSSLVSTEENYSNCKELINYYLEKGNTLGALIIDGVCYQNTFDEKITKSKFVTTENEHKEVKNSTFEFKNSKLIKHLTSLDDRFISYFLNTYNVSKKQLEDSIERVNSLSTKKLQDCVKKVFVELKSNEEVKSILCY